ncbi:MAG: MCE family protein [Planctomycetota bacterium]|nr:MAG: MCE family protein [Planctomycetota bacterium]
MDNNIHTASKTNFWVGIFSLVILALSVVLIVFFLGKSRPFESTILVKVNFDNIEGLKVGAHVNLEGLNIGRVSHIQLYVAPNTNRPRHQVFLKLRNDPVYLRWITNKSKFQIVNDNFFGDKHVEISFSNIGEPISHLQVVEGSNTASINKVLGNLEKITVSAQELISRLAGIASNPMVSNVSMSTLTKVVEMVDSVTSAANLLEKFLKGEEVGKVKDILANLERTSQSVRSISTKVDALLNERQQKRITQSIAKLERSMSSLEKVSSTLEKRIGGKQGRALLSMIFQTIENFAKTSKELAYLTSQASKSLSSSNKQNINLQKTLQEMQSAAINLNKITKKILDVLDAPSRFMNRFRLFRRKKDREE